MPVNSVKMAQTKIESSKPKDNGKKEKKGLSTLLTVAAIVVIIAVVIGGVFYYIIRNNIGGAAERYRPAIQGIPLLRRALPEAEDPLDPKNMTQAQLIEKYNEFRKENAGLEKQLEDATAKGKEYLGYKDELDKIKLEDEKKQQEAKDREAALDKKEADLKEMELNLGKLAASGDKEGFKAYFEKLDPETAEQLYAEILKEEETAADVKKFAGVYAEMDEAAAAAIFEQLGTGKIDMTAETLKAMSKKDSAEIIESMDPDFAAKVTEKLNELYKAD